MEILILGVAILVLSIFTDLDDVFFGLPLLPATSCGMITYGALTFTTFSTTVSLIAAIAAAIFIGCVYKKATSTTSNDLNK